MTSVASEIAGKIGAQIDARTTIRSGAGYMVGDPGDLTMREVLGYIAAAHAGNWIMTPAGKLRLVPLVSAAGAASATANAIDVAAVTGEMSLQAAGTVTGVRYTAEDEPVVLGDETGIVIDADVGATIASALYDDLVGMTYQTYRLTGVV